MMFFFAIFCLCCACFIVPSACLLLDGAKRHIKSTTFNENAFMEMFLGIGGLLIGLGMFFANYSIFFN